MTMRRALSSLFLILAVAVIDAAGQPLPKFKLATEDGERLLTCTFPAIEMARDTPNGKDRIRIEMLGLKKGTGTRARHGIEMQIFIPNWENGRDYRETLGSLRLGEKDCQAYAEALLAARGFAKKVLTEEVQRREFFAKRWNWIVVTTNEAKRPERLRDSDFPRLLLMYGESAPNRDWAGIPPSFQDEVVSVITRQLLGFENTKTLLDRYNADL